MTQPIDESLVRGLVARQFPRWADLPVRQVLPGGNDNRTFRLGDQYSVRLPSAPGYAAAVAKEQAWLPVIARTVPLPVPEVVAAGESDDTFPHRWSIYRWLPGETATDARVADRSAFAETLAGFLRALQTVDTEGAPRAGAHSFFRGANPAHYDDETREAVSRLGSAIDGDRALALWSQGLAAEWTGGPVWFHGDVSSGNLLVVDGALSAVVDFGTSGVGDPACDLYIAWTYLDGPSRRAFRTAMRVDDGMWARGRAWTLWKALITLASADYPARSWAWPVYESIVGADER